MIRLTVFSLAIALWSMVAAPAHADEFYKNDTYGFSVEIPQRWVSVSPDVVTQINTAVAMFLQQKVTYLACLVPKGRTSQELPRILVQFQPWDGGAPTYEALEESLKRDIKDAVKEVKKEIVPLRSLEVGDVSLDRSTNRLLMRMQASVAGDGTVQGLSVGMLGKDGIIFLHCYAKQDKFARSMALFEVFADSFQFVKGKEYNPADATVTSIPHGERKRNSGSFSWLGASRGGMTGAIIGGSVGAIAMALRSLRRRVV